MKLTCTHRNGSCHELALLKRRLAHTSIGDKTTLHMHRQSIASAETTQDILQSHEQNDSGAYIRFRARCCRHSARVLQITFESRKMINTPRSDMRYARSLAICSIGNRTHSTTTYDVTPSRLSTDDGLQKATLHRNIKNKIIARK